MIEVIKSIDELPDADISIQFLLQGRDCNCDCKAPTSR